MKKKTPKKQVRRRLSRLLNKLDMDFDGSDEECLSELNLAEVKYGVNFVRPYMDRYYATWRKQRK